MGVAHAKTRSAGAADITLRRMSAEKPGVRLGFLGTGTITSAIVTGLHSTPSPRYSVCLSPRNEHVAARLASAFPSVTVAATNQEMLDSSDIVFLAVRPQVAREVLAGLEFRPDHHVVSLVATFSRDAVAALVDPASNVMCAVPMPTVAAHLGPTAIFPPDAIVAALFDQLGAAVEVTTEKEFQSLAAATAAMASYFTLLGTLVSWLTEQGVSEATARAYISMMFYGLSQAAQRSDRSFVELAGEFKTKGGLNEQFADELARNGVFGACSTALDRILARIKSNTNPT
jgi:pyrroline-5-carboxylate reductase